MIKKFDRKYAVPLFRREFAECFEVADYEGAIDRLLKYSEFGNPDFHLHMGMLYFLLTQDCDDRELLTLAFREFMMHVSAHPDCRAAYLSLLAIAILRRDTASVLATTDFIKDSGQNLSEIVDELSAHNIDFFNDDGDFIDLEGLYPMTAFGDLGSGASNWSEYEDDGEAAPAERKPAANAAAKNKVIGFRGLSASERSDAEVVATENKIIPMRRTPDISDAQADIPQMSDVFEIMIDLARNESSDDEEDDPNADDLAIEGDILEHDGSVEGLTDKLTLRKAQDCCRSREFDKALGLLDTIGRDNDKLYYYAECMRANIYVDMEVYAEANAALDRACAVHRGGALAGMLRCGLYESQKRFADIPAALFAIDTADFIDSPQVCRAFLYAVKYCTKADAAELGRRYVDEFNSYDIRKLYAQFKYNIGEREEAESELELQARVFYDDFSAQYFYMVAASGMNAMPVADSIPSELLGIMIDAVIDIVGSEAFSVDRSLIDSDPFRYGLEMFLTLEFSNTRSVMSVMFDTLRKLATDDRLETQMTNSIVSPYVEPIVKSVVLGELLAKYKGKLDFVTEESFCPISSRSLPKPLSGMGRGYYTAYAIAAVNGAHKLDALNACAKKFKKAAIAATDERAVAYYLCKQSGVIDALSADVRSRIEYAIGYEKKSQANAGYKAVKSAVDAHNAD